MNVRSWRRILLGSLLLGAVAVAGIALNFTLLGLTQDANEPVGKLSPRAVFTDRPTTTAPTTPVSTTTTTTTPTTSTTTGSGDGSSRGVDHPPGDGDSDDD